MTIPLPAIRRDLRFTPHLQHNALWYAVEDPLTGRFLRLGRQEYLAATQFDGIKTSQAIIAEANSLDSRFQLTEADVSKLTGWLARVGFLVTAHPPKAPSQVEDTNRSDKVPLSSKSIWDPLGARFAIIRGEYVELLASWLQPLVSFAAAILVAILALAAALTVIANWQQFFESTSKLFVAEGRVWWIVAWLMLKVVHELGHAVTAVRAGSQIRSAGISFFFFAPVPYIDVSDLWSITNRWQRILCSAGGMLFEIAVASLAVFVAFLTENESLRYLACAIATTGTFTTLAMNANPFVRFDGYYILSDLIQKPNLWSDGQGAIRASVKQLLHPFSAQQDAISLSLLTYGLICCSYRTAILVGTACWALIVWQEYGLLIIGWASYAWFIAPWLKARVAAKIAKTTNPQNSGRSMRAWWQPIAVTSVIVILLFLPSPVQPTVPGVITLREPSPLRNRTEGTLVRVCVCDAQTVEVGDLIAQFENPQLKQILAIKEVEVAATIESISAMRARGELAGVQAEQAKLISLKDQLAQVQRDVADLEVRAESAGTVLCSDLQRQLGKFFRAGQPLAMVARTDELEIKLFANQQDQHSLRAFEGRSIHISNSSLHQFTGMVEKIDFRGSDLLDEPSLAATYGGPITVAIGSQKPNENGLKLTAPRFEVSVRVDSTATERLVPGQLAFARIPNSSSSLLDAIHRWFSKKWEAVKKENTAS